MPSGKENKEIKMVETDDVKTEEGTVSQIATIDRVRISLFNKEEIDEETSLAERFSKQQLPEGKSIISSNGFRPGIVERPFDFHLAKSLKHINTTQGSCLDTSVSCLVGMGFETENDRKKKEHEGPGPFIPSRKITDRFSKVELELSKYCRRNFSAELMSMTRDLEETGSGYLEVVFSDDKRTEITAIYWLDTTRVWPEVESDGVHFHYLVRDEDGNMWAVPEYADTDFVERSQKADFGTFSPSGLAFQTATEEGQQGELRTRAFSAVIPFVRPSNESRWYGDVTWKSNIPKIELNSAHDQHLFDFFNNRGVPEFFLFVTGGQVNKKDWMKIEDALKANVGSGNAYKSAAVNLQAPDVQVQLEKLMVESAGAEDYGEKTASFSSSITSSWGIPPLLAGVTIPGKMGANNELPNALVAYQTLRVAPIQDIIMMTLMQTLGNSEINAQLDLTPEDFILNTIMDHYDLEKMDTMSRMRENVSSAQAKGRDLEDGLVEDGRKDPGRGQKVT